MPEPHPLLGAIETQILPVSDARHQLDTRQVREGEHRFRLAMGVRVHGIGLNAQACLHQALDNVDRFQYPWWYEVAKNRDVVVGDMPIGHGPHAPVPEMHAHQQILVVEVVLGAICRDLFAFAPQLG